MSRDPTDQETLPASGESQARDSAEPAVAVRPDDPAGSAATLEAPHLPALPLSSPGDELPFPGWERYQIVAFLGAGGMGSVYRANDPRLQRKVAIKFLRTAQLEVGEVRQRRRFAREARAQARIEHPHICKIYEVGEVGRQPYIAMQLISGSSLGGLHPVMTREQKVLAIQQVAEALHAAHVQGVIHRDLKPGNIMVERRQDGTWWPYLMDFGLAQEVNANTQTITGGIEGTPAFMAPEQVRGETRLLDRRTDVYGLGATLYTVLAGRPPFIGSSTEVLLAVMFNEPPPLRQFDPAVPGDLETIVLKCLEKDPQRRYDSAKALADDLARYLEGTRITARPPGLRQRLGKFTRRHKLLVVSFGAALIASLVLGAIGLRLRWQAATRARLAQELGQDIKELEMFMRSAYGLPIHDIAREQAVVRSRMARFTSTLHSANSQAAATLRYALGRGHLVLREYPEAQAALEASWQGGYQTPAAQLALGLVLGERYRQELEQAQRVGDKQWVEQREQALFTQYLQPALAYLEGASSNIEAPSYIAGLLKFYRKQYEPALALAQHAQAEAPWLAEPLRLEGDVYQVLGIGLVDRGRRGEGRALLVRAAERHRLAADISRSDSAIYAAAAVDWIRTMEVDSKTGAALDEAEKGALTATASAIRCDPRAARGFQLQGWAYWRLGQTKRARKQGGEFELQQSVASGEKAVAINPLDWQSYYYHSLGLAELARLVRRRGDDASDLNHKAIAALQQTIKLNKNFAWAWNDLGNLYFDSFSEKTSHGELDTSVYAEAISCFQKAAQLDPGYANPHGNLVNLVSEKIDFLLQHGKSIESDAAVATAAVTRELAIKPDSARGYGVAAALLLDKIAYAALCQTAPRELFAEASAVLAELRRVAPASKETDLAYANFYSLRATSELALGHDPSPAIVAGLQAVAEGEKKDATDFSFAAYKARFYMTAGRALGSQESADRALLQAVVAAQRAVALFPNNAEPYDVLCETFRYAAAARGNRRKLTPWQSAETAHWIERGLDACTAAITINPTRPTAYGNGGALFLLQAQRAAEPAAVQLAAARATDALGQAQALNQCLGREYDPLLDSARALGRKPDVSGAPFRQPPGG